MTLFIRLIGQNVLSFCAYLGQLLLLAFDSFRSIFTAPIRWKLFMGQLLEVGYRSQLVRACSRYWHNSYDSDR